MLGINRDINPASMDKVQIYQQKRYSGRSSKLSARFINNIPSIFFYLNISIMVRVTIGGPTMAQPVAKALARAVAEFSWVNDDVEAIFYDRAVDRLTERAKDAFILFRDTCQRNPFEMHNCVCLKSMGTVSDCREICHAVWDWPFGQSKCPCNRWGEEVAWERLENLCAAIERDRS
jgi:hypothetical protein